MEILAQQVLKLGSYFYLGHGRIERDRFNLTSLENDLIATDRSACNAKTLLFCLRKLSQFFCVFCVSGILYFPPPELNLILLVAGSRQLALSMADGYRQSMFRL